MQAVLREHLNMNLSGAKRKNKETKKKQQNASYTKEKVAHHEKNSPPWTVDNSLVTIPYSCRKKKKK